MKCVPKGQTSCQGIITIRKKPQRHLTAKDILSRATMVFVDPDNMNAGMRFDGRISEDFKLLTGTWVRATALRMSLLGHFAPLAADLVITGQDKSDIGVLISRIKRRLKRLVVG